MNKEDFCFTQVTMCIQTMGEAWNNKVRGIYYPDTKKEIAYDKKEKTFFVFENVNQGINYREYDDNGDGTLIKIFKNLGEAKKFASKKEVILSSLIEFIIIFNSVILIATFFAVTASKFIMENIFELVWAFDFKVLFNLGLSIGLVTLVLIMITNLKYLNPKVYPLIRNQ